MKEYTFKEHFLELKKRLIILMSCFIAIFLVCYYFSDDIYSFILKPLAKVMNTGDRKVIYTGMTEAFFTYVKLSVWTAFLVIIPLITYQIYAFIAPGLLPKEKAVILPTLLAAPLLFYIGGLFVFYLIMPNAWKFFLSFENSTAPLPIILEAKISEYLSVVMQLVTAFGLAFELPVAILILAVLKLVSSHGLRLKRRLAIVIIFILAAIFTPPDVLSQIALALPLVALYEISIIICNFVERRSNQDVRH